MELDTDLLQQAWNEWPVCEGRPVPADCLDLRDAWEGWSVNYRATPPLRDPLGKAWDEWLLRHRYPSPLKQDVSQSPPAASKTRRTTNSPSASPNPPHTNVGHASSSCIPPPGAAEFKASSQDAPPGGVGDRGALDRPICTAFSDESSSHPHPQRSGGPENILQEIRADANTAFSDEPSSPPSPQRSGGAANILQEIGADVNTAFSDEPSFNNPQRSGRPADILSLQETRADVKAIARMWGGAC